ncbi:MAG: MerR family transcriptional regulator [Gammaproteobacteria bacterium]|nr:MAG: MerR family transcriptional regulator [Gammaproteobacteria bacterium]
MITPRLAITSLAEKIQLACIARSEGNFRVYSEQTKQQLRFIKRCKTLGLTLVEIGQLQRLDHTPQTSCDKINDMVNVHIQEVEAQINELIHLREQLSALGSCCANNRTIEQCGILEKIKHAYVDGS